MKLKFIKAQEIDKNVKASVHNTGKLGFSIEAINKLKLDDMRSVLIAINEDEEDGNLYIKLENEIVEDGFKLSKAGNYYYINTKAFFDNHGVDYRRSKIIYDIVEVIYEGEKIYKLIKREVKKKMKENYK